jgi:hypothetical protein
MRSRASAFDLSGDLIRNCVEKCGLATGAIEMIDPRVLSALENFASGKLGERAFNGHASGAKLVSALPDPAAIARSGVPSHITIINVGDIHLAR